jgi:hypothetical protein
MHSIWVGISAAHLGAGLRSTCSLTSMSISARASESLVKRSIALILQHRHAVRNIGLIQGFRRTDYNPSRVHHAEINEILQPNVE